MKVNRHTSSLHLDGEDGSALVVRYDNRGDPYRQGVTIELREAGSFSAREVTVFLEGWELEKLRDKLIELCPPRPPRANPDPGVNRDRLADSIEAAPDEPWED